MPGKTHKERDLFGAVPTRKPARHRAPKEPEAAVRSFPLYATVAVNEPLDRLLDYGVPAELDPAPVEGAIVEVPFRKRKARGCVVRLATTHSEGVEPAGIKPVLRVLTPGFQLSPALLWLGSWICDYYMAFPGECLSCVSFIGFNDLHSKLLVRLRLADDWQSRAESLAADNPGSRRGALTAKQKSVLATLVERHNKPAGALELQQVAGVGAAVVQKLVARGLLERVVETQVREDEYGAASARDRPLAYNPAQRIAHDRITAAMDLHEARTFVLHGVTGSGKTEVYLQAIDKALAEGGDAIVLVPEISLTPQTVSRFRSRFGQAVGVYHSRLTLGQKYDLWQRVRTRSCRVVVGARSAVFTPFENLRIIVIDEEQETSYKQDSAPRYHARDVAIVRAQRDKCVVVLGSATPSVETFYKALSRKFDLLSLPERIDQRPLPEVQVVDMVREAKDNQNSDLFSEPLRSAIAQTLDEHCQALLFINRRGFFNFMICMDCHSAVRCDHCDVTLTFHKPLNMLVCHYCNRRKPPPPKCPDCEKTELSLVGVGTQRIEEHVSELFPAARIIRMDLDTTRHRTAYLDAWHRIERGDADIILGTQMIAKGFHLEKVTLVGVPLADVSLFQPDFRSAERAFSLLTQVAGRAGRGEKPGRVVIQSYVPYHYAVQYAQTHDYRGFYDKEIRVRQVLRFPPLFRLISVLAVGTDSARTANLMKEFSRHLRTAAFHTNDAVSVLGPAPAPIGRIDDDYRWRVLIRGQDHRLMKNVLREALKRYEETKGRSAVQLLIDVDPLDLL